MTLDVLELFRFLGCPTLGGAELICDTRSGVFDDPTALEAAVEDYKAQGAVTIGIQPRALTAVTNRMRVHVADVPVERFATVALHVQHPDDGEADSATIAMRFVQRQRHAFVWRQPDDSCVVLLAIPPLDLTGADIHDVAAALTDYAAKLTTIIGLPATKITALANPRAVLQLEGSALHVCERAELPKLAAILQRTIHPAILKLLNASRGRIARLFRGEGIIGHDGHGREIQQTPENYDRAFIEAVRAKLKDEVSRDDLGDALWNRPGCAARQRGGIDGVMAIVDAVLDAERTSSTPTSAQALGAPPPATVDRYAPNVPLRDRLWADYKEWSDRSGRYVWSVKTDLSVKAQKVIDFLLDQGAELYFFKESQEVMFVLDGVMYQVDVRDHDFQKWFATNVKMFGVFSSHGRELTNAVRAAVETHERCHKLDKSRWGHFDREREAIYLCLDPEHSEMVRIRASSNGKPDVTTVPNGTDGVTLRGPLARLRRFVYVPGMVDGFKLFKRHVHQGQALPELERLMSTAFNLATLIPDHMQRPIKFHCGPQGSGKTNACYDWETVLYGRTYSSDYSDKPALLHALKHAGPIVTQDNAEASVRRRFLQLYLVAATGSAHRIRKYYTESQHVVFEPNASMYLTAIEPMALPEHIRRSFEFRFDAKHFDDVDNREVPHERSQFLQANADTMLSAVLDIFSVYILPHWRVRYEAAARFIGVDCPRTAKHSFLDWLAWMLLMVESVGRYLWSGATEFDPRALFLAYMSSIARDELSAGVTGSSLLSCLDQLRFDGVIRITNDPMTDWRSQTCETYVHGVRVARDPDGSIHVGPVTSASLFRAFSSVSKQMGVKMEFLDGRAFAARMAVLEDDAMFQSQGWNRQKLPGRAHGNVSKFLYTYTPDTPPPVSLAVPDSPELPSL